MAVGNDFAVRREQRPVRHMLYSAHMGEQRRGIGAPGRMALGPMDCVPGHTGRAVQLSSRANIRRRSR
jgi:hypothetical protein